MGAALRGGRLSAVWSPPALAAFAKTKWPMKTRREEEAISAAGHRERGGGSRRKGFAFWRRQGDSGLGCRSEHK
jgi:hypothetical protein